MLKDFRGAFLCSLALFGLLLLPAASYAQSGIQMLPPIQGGTVNTTCPSSGPPKVLAWNGKDPLYCIINFTTDVNGNVGVASLATPTIHGPVTIDNNSGNASAVDLTVAHYMQSGGAQGGAGGLWVAPNQLFGSKDATSFGLWNGSSWGLTLTGNDVKVAGNMDAVTYTIPGADGPLDKAALNAIHSLPVCTGAGKSLQFDGTIFHCVDADNICTPAVGSCSAAQPACGETTTGVDNCGTPCSRTGPACACIPDGSCSAPAPSCGQTTTGVDNCGACSRVGSPCSTTVDGRCGGGGVQSVSTTPPSGPDLCRGGNPSAVNTTMSTDNSVTWVKGWNWTCQGTGSPLGQTANCTVLAGGQCGTASGVASPDQPPTSGTTLCSLGYSAYLGNPGGGPYSGGPFLNYTNWQWQCAGYGGSSMTTCFAPLNGRCGPANGQSFTLQYPPYDPDIQLGGPTGMCAYGMFENYTGPLNAPWSWQCRGGASTASCSASLR